MLRAHILGGMFLALAGLSSLSMLCFGLGYLFSPRMRAEFGRYRLSRYRRLVAWLQLAGACGLMLGLLYPPIGSAAAAGLTAMMLVAVGVRFNIGDSLLQSAPAGLYLILNLYLSVAFLR